MACGFSSRRFLRGLQNVLMLPACDASMRAGRAATLEGAVAARIGPVAPQLFAVLLVGGSVLQTLAGRTAIGVLVGHVDKVLFAEPPRPFRARCHWLWQCHRDAGLVALQDLWAVE